MQKFKIDNFIDDFPGDTFPGFKTLSEESIKIIRERLIEKSKLGLSE